MNFRNHLEKKEVEIGLAPMIDVVFLLLIFFMVAANFDNQQQITVNLPPAQSGQAVEKIAPMVITITKAGEFYIKEQLIEKTALSDFLQQNQPVALHIKADASLAYQTVVEVLDIAHMLDIQKTSLIVDKK